MSHLLKILHLNASDKGGAFQVANNLVENLNQSEGIFAHHLVYTGKNSNFKFTKINLLDKIIKFGLHSFEKLIFLYYQKNKKYRFIFSLGYPGIPWFILKKKLKNMILSTFIGLIKDLSICIHYQK